MYRGHEGGPARLLRETTTHTIAEARELAELSRTSKVITRTGNQGSASANLRRSIELIQAGLLGDVSNVHVWHPAHGWPSGVSRPTGKDNLPAGLNLGFLVWSLSIATLQAWHLPSRKVAWLV